MENAARKIESRETRMWTLSVRDLVAFVLRAGSLSRAAFRSVRRAHEGTEGHVRVQSQRPPGYQAEVFVADRIEGEGFILRIQGRIDGVLRNGSGLLVEEIKTVVTGWTGEPHPLHWAQAKVYAALILRSHPDDDIDGQLTYLNLDTDEFTVFRQRFTRAELELFYRELTDACLAWLTEHFRHLARRDEVLRRIGFPFGQTRQGQREMMAKVSEVLDGRRCLLVEAPTGIGKTIAVLLPAAKALLDERYARIVYATAKTTGHAAVGKAVRDLGPAGRCLRVLALSARDRLCFGAEGGRPCDPESCPYAQGYYDRYREPLRAVLQGDIDGWLDLAALRALGERYQVCPSALAADLLPWMDVVVADYNYLFDPQIRLAMFDAGEQGESILLIDEAHNLPDRARRMLSAELSVVRLRHLRRALGQQLVACGRALERATKAIDESFLPESGRTWMTLEKWPRGLRRALREFLREADVWFARNQEGSFQEALLELYFEVGRLLKLAELGNRETHALLLEKKSGKARSPVLRWLCLDPAPHLENVRRETGPAIFFSATLAPLEYYARLLGTGPQPEVLCLDSPFPREHLCLSVHAGIGTTYRTRAASYDAVADLLVPWVSGKVGNYWVFFSSYAYLTEIEERFRRRMETGRKIDVLVQQPEMSVEERENFMQAFDDSGRRTRVGFAVLGGVFGEGVDLLGERLIGVAVVGVGLPQICLENDLIKERFRRTRRGIDERRGFDFAYTFPGFNRVLQAVGRLQRTETDRGVVLLMGERYAEQRYRALFPSWWSPRMVRSATELQERQGAFWEGEPEERE